MELGIVEKWQHSQQVELFYNSTQRKLVFKKFNYIYSKGVDDFHSYPYIDLRDFSAIFKTASFSPQDNIIAFQRNEENLEILILESYQHIVLQGKNRRILGYHWISESSYSDLVVIDTNGVEFFKLLTPILKLSSVKVYPISIGHYWFSPDEGILLVSLSPPKLGQFWTFFINQNKGSKMFHGPKFTLELSPCVTDKWTFSPTNVSSLTQVMETLEHNSPHTISIEMLYGSSYLFHIQCLNGILKVFLLKSDKIEEFRTFQLRHGQYGIRSVDNLVLMQNYTAQETYIIDIKSDKYIDKHFCLFWNNMKDVLPTVNVKIKVFIEKPKIVAQSTFLYDGKVIQDLSSYVGSETLNGEATECKMQLNPLLLYTDNDICIDTKNGRCYKLQLSPLAVVEKHPDLVECALFLFRRTGLKSQAYDYLNKCIYNYIPLKEISAFFMKTSENYKKSLVEKKIPTTPRQSVSKNDMYSRRLSFNLEPELKVEEGTVVLLQTDVFNVMFKFLFEENHVKLDYLAAVLQEYIRSLTYFDIEVQSAHQLLLAKILVKAGLFNKFQDLIIYSAVSDSYEIVNYLISLIPIHYNSLQLSVDMLFRLRAYEKLIDLSLDKNFIYETLMLLTKNAYPKFDIMKLLSKCEECKDEQLTSVVTQFIKEKSL
ncbi:hypothetical protein SteCoe_35020 [Stentor coeruleus]|uniref:Uncharacterized protein n=1 Tax=Stentor coeruleus TaxID=5963 RepID=A0A1R2AT97_9CILI|nr:hypothetical protein SteCoe_35020 [Stentor coeruleus]